MKIIPETQGTEQWLAWRESRWMASEAAVIMGAAPRWMEVKTWDDLRLQKAGLFEHSKGAQRAFAHGHEREDAARELFARRLWAYDVDPGVCVENELVPKIAASLDGLVKDKGTGDLTGWVEIKCPISGKKSPLLKAETFDDIPEHYQWQLIHQWAAIGDNAVGWLFVYVDDETYNIVEFSPGKCGFPKRSSDLFKAWLTFENGGKSGRTDNQWTWWAEQYIECHAAAEKAKANLDEARKELIELGGGEGCGVKVSEIERKGSIDWKAVAESLWVHDSAEAFAKHAEEYRKAGSKAWRITI